MYARIYCHVKSLFPGCYKIFILFFKIISKGCVNLFKWWSAERETETLNRARQLVFNNDNLMPPTPPPHPHLVLGYMFSSSSYS